MKNSIKSIAIALALVTFGCGSGGGNGEGGGDTPATATLLFPQNNSECLEGESISATQSKVTFEWSAAENADSYVVYVKNLNTQTTSQYNAAATSLEITLLKGVPYSWSVKSKSSNSTATANSSTWNFYNAGDGTVNYAPFPAEIVSPLMSSTVNTATVNFQWNGNDIDGDIVEYKFYLDSNTNPTTLKNTSGVSTVNNIPVTANTTYYWKVITKDSAGNTSTSPVFQFKTL